MAKKGQKFKRYADEEKSKIISEYLDGRESLKSIAEKYGITSRKTVFNWLRKYRNTGTTREKINFINIFKTKYKLKDLFDVLNISKSNYFKYYKQVDKDYDKYLLIKEIFDESKGTYGYRRIEKGLLQKWGLIMNHKKM